jgi:hypothetical protein
VTTTRIGDVIDALVTTMRTALPNVLVVDGVGVSADRNPNALFIGVDTPEDTSGTPVFAADTRQQWANANYTARDEEGYVVCAASSFVGETNQKQARDNALATVASVETTLRANPSLGVAGLLWLSVGTRIALVQNQTTVGSHAIILFRVSWKARL